MKYKVTVHSSQIIEANSKEEALENYYGYTDGSELEPTVALIKKKIKKK